MKRTLFYTILGVVVLLFTNCEPKINFNTGNNLLYWGYNVDAQYDKLAYYGFVGGDRFDCMYEDSWSLKIYQVIVKKKNLYLYTRDTIPSLGKFFPAQINLVRPISSAILLRFFLETRFDLIQE